MGLRELFIEILERYPQAYAQDNKVSSPYYKDLKQRLEQIFQPLLDEFGFEINALGGQGVMRKTPYITFLAEGHRTNKGIYPNYHFDLDQQLVYLGIGDADEHEPPPELAQQFATLAVDLLGQFQNKEKDGYPRKIYAKEELQENTLIADLRTVFEVYQVCLDELHDQVQAYLYTGRKRPLTAEKPVIGQTQLEKLWERFHRRISGFTDFTSPGVAFLDQELRYKRHALQRYQQEFGNHKVRALLQEGQGLLALKEISKRVATNFVHYTSWRQSIGETDRQATAILQAFWDVAQQAYQGAQTLLPIFEQIEQQGLSRDWDTFSVLLWAMRPTDYAPIKISYCRKLAEELGHPLPSGKPTPEKFEAVLQWMCAFRDALQPYHPADWIDVQSFIWCVCPRDTPEEMKYWTIAPGENARLWEEFKRESIIAIGWDTLGDLTQYGNKETIRKALQDITQIDDSKRNDALACYEFSRVMQIGDYLLAKKGRELIIGLGQVTSDYFYDTSRIEYQHVRQVKWLSEGQWQIPEGITTFSTKTLTNVTPYQEWLKTILALIKTPSSKNVSQPSFSQPDATDVKYWWLNANPKIWNFNDISIGEKQTYTSRNEKGNKRPIYAAFEEIKAGDLVLGYVTSPQKEIAAICRITQGLHASAENEVIEFEKIEQLEKPVSFSVLQNIPELQHCRPIINNMGSLFPVTIEEYELIRAIIDEHNPPHPQIKIIEGFSKEQALENLFLAEPEFDDMLALLTYKKNMILQGPPGVGKSFIAKQFAYALIGFKDDEKVEMIQFHQAYSYEDFMQGFRPNADGKFSLQNGVFYEFCKKAQRDEAHKYVFIIDEINRGNLSKIFGELMLLIEPDKRGKDFAMKLTYSPEEVFYLPENLYVIGLMNTADRSLAMVDYALRRRFSFVDLKPQFSSPKYKAFLHQKGVSEALSEKIIARLTEVNAQIADDPNLGWGYCLGHSFFCPNNENQQYDDAWYQQVIAYEIAPLLREYWFDDRDKADALIRSLRTL